MHSAAIVSLWVGNAALAAGLGYWFGRIIHRSSSTKSTANPGDQDDASNVLEELRTDLAWFDDDCSHATIDLDAIACEFGDSNVTSAHLRETIERFIKAGRSFERRLERSQTQCSRIAARLGGLWVKLARSTTDHRSFVGTHCSQLERDLAKLNAQSPLAIPALLATIKRLAERNRALQEELNQVKHQLLERESRLINAQRDARIDGLTHLANRRAFEERLNECHLRAVRHQEKYAIAIFDLDRFKQINDQYGHPFGDAILAVFGRILAETIRTSDIAARYGGEEFVILLPGADAAAALSVAERCRRQAERSVVRRGNISASFTVSGGVAAWTEGAMATEVMEAADQALYVAKSEGRNRIQNATDTATDESLLVSAVGG